LNDLGIHTVLDLKRAEPEYIRQQFNVVLEKTVRELRGQACIELEEIAPAKKSIVKSRSFGQPVTDINELREAVSAFTTRAAEKLRQQQSYATLITTFIHTSPFNPDPAQRHAASYAVKLPAPTDSTLQLVNTSIWILKQIYKPGFRYIKAGVMLDEIVPAGGRRRTFSGSRMRAMSDRPSS
jgi:DNA polymerase V